MIIAMSEEMEKKKQSPLHAFYHGKQRQILSGG
jgi:hypothetical protein